MTASRKKWARRIQDECTMRPKSTQSLQIYLVPYQSKHGKISNTYEQETVEEL